MQRLYIHKHTHTLPKYTHIQVHSIAQHRAQQNTNAQTKTERGLDLMKWDQMMYKYGILMWSFLDGTR